jgi:hypothetical protein
MSDFYVHICQAAPFTALSLHLLDQKQGTKAVSTPMAANDFVIQAVGVAD